MAKSKSSTTTTSSKANATSAASSSKKAAGKSKKSNTNKKDNRKAAPAPPPSSKFLTCSETGEKVFVATATLADIQNPPTGSQRQRRKILYKIPSAKIRTQLYEELALCLEDRETRLLPKYGGRPWTVLCRVQDSAASKSSPFFRWFRGKLELAVLPHILDKIPDPPKFPGYVQTEYGVVRQLVKSDNNNNNNNNNDDNHQYAYDNLTEEEIQRMESLQGRESSTLSQVAWDHRNDARHGAPLPTISIKWTCPLRQIFTTRKAAWDHALELAKAEQFVDRFLHGLGKHGAPLKPFRPSRAQALQAGKVRFLRDGLWVVGQEQHWQNERFLAMERLQQQQQQQQQEEEEAKIEAAANSKKRQQQQCNAGETTNGNSERLRKRRKITGHAMFLSLNRVAYRDQRIKELNSKKGAHAKSEPQNNNNEKDSKPAARSKTAAKVGLPSPPPPQKKKASKNNSNNKVSFTLGDAEKELRTMWKKKLSDEEKQAWDIKAATSFQRKIDDDDEAQWELARKIDEEESESESGDESSENDESAEADQDTNESPKEEEEQSDATSKGGETDNSKEDGDDEESTCSAKLATEQERRLWEILSEAEQELWKARISKDMLSNDAKPHLARSMQRSVYTDYQRRVYDSFIGMSPEEYETYSTRNMKASDKKKHLKELGHLKELILEGMKLIGPKAHAVLQKRIEKWVTGGIQSANQAAKRREQAKKAAAASLPSSDSPASTTSPKRIAVDPPGVTFGGANDNVAAKQDDKAELKTLLSNQVGSVTVNGSPTTTIQPDSQLAVVSTPISPSPTLVEPMAAAHHEKNNSPQVPEVTATGWGTHENCLVETSDEKAMAETITSSAAAAAAVSLPDASSSDEEEEAESDEEEEIAEVPRFIPTEHFCLNEEQIKLCMDASMEHFDAVMRTVKAKDLTRELVDGFDVLRERGRGRYDMELPVFDTKKFDFLNDINKAPWMPIVRQVLGDDVVLIHKGCFLSLPDAANQVYHQDGTHLTSQTQRPCHAVNVFTPLVDMTLRHGPTEFCLGSHVLGQEDWDRRFIETPLPKKGVPVMFDYRLGHRGLANTSKDPRPIVYCTYARARDGKEFRDSVNFSRKRYRKLGEIVEKPLSREERNEKRRVYRGV